MIAISLLLFILLILNLTKSNHDIDYNVGKYNVEEKFKKDHYIIKIYNNNQYDILITKGKFSYIYTLNNKFGKRKKIIREIKKVESNDLKCIVPIYKNNITKQIYCTLKDKQVSINYLVQTNNNDFRDVETKIKKLGIKIPKDNAKKKTYKGINYYSDNFNGEQLALWNY